MMAGLRYMKRTMKKVKENDIEKNVGKKEK